MSIGEETSPNAELLGLLDCASHTKIIHKFGSKMSYVCDGKVQERMCKILLRESMGMQEQRKMASLGSNPSTILLGWLGKRQGQGLGYADYKTGYYTYYQSLLPHHDVNKDISNAFWNIPCISTRMIRKTFQCHTGTLYNQKRDVCFKRSSCLVCPLPECHHMDIALHILSVCQCPVIRNMVTERHNISSKMILKVVSEGSYSSNLVHMDVGSADRLA
eukprot:1161112-Pelagomonas_calceolata.AAC.17